MKRILLILAVFSPMLFQVQEVRYKKKFRGFDVKMINAVADTLLTGSAVFTTDLDKANFVRYYYYSVNGAAPGYSLYNMSYLDQVNSFIQGVGTSMADLGYSTCSDIPTSGTFNALEYLGTFGVGNKTIPSNFPDDTGLTYDKRISLSMGGEEFIEIQIKCPSSGSRISGYILIGNQSITQGTMNEIMFQMDESTNTVLLDYVLWVSNAKKFFTRFSTTDGESYKLYTLFLWDGYYNAVAINGEAGGKTNFNILYTNNTGTTTYSTTIHSISGITNDVSQQAYNACIDMSTNSSTTGCSAITDPGQLTLNSTNYNLNFSSLSSLTTSTFP